MRAPVTVTATIDGHVYTATETPAGKVSISRDGRWAGDGRIVNERIVDCAAQLADTAEASEAVYCSLEESLNEARA